MRASELQSMYGGHSDAAHREGRRWRRGVQDHATDGCTLNGGVGAGTGNHQKKLMSRTVDKKLPRSKQMHKWQNDIMAVCSEMQRTGDGQRSGTRPLLQNEQLRVTLVRNNGRTPTCSSLATEKGRADLEGFYFCVDGRVGSERRCRRRQRRRR